MENFLPSKTCPVCNETFSWQKKWSDCWHRVVYCSSECKSRDEHGDDDNDSSATEPDNHHQAAE